jgi:hypothetical protein
MWQRFRAWLASYSITAKSIVGAWVALNILYDDNQAFHDFVHNNIFQRFPHVQEIVVGFLVPVSLVIGHLHKTKKEEAA